ncbi:hypothetical protein NDU88_005396 [Pleurodeles waltl]|uniref:Uncharacterized protein n=1 Tax=Pleurodeles waltl TaxID=8319 RepID=A0AAV7SLN1_PLEWA|nr:hypothetical protein NDU88_005396 [Pleurodeles waltl]
MVMEKVEGQKLWEHFDINTGLVPNKQGCSKEISSGELNEELISKIIQHEMRVQVKDTLDGLLKEKKRKELESCEENFSLTEDDEVRRKSGKILKKTKHIEKSDCQEKGKHGFTTFWKKGVLNGTQRTGVLHGTHRESVRSDLNTNYKNNAEGFSVSDLDNELDEYVLDITQDDDFNVENEDFETSASKEMIRNPLGEERSLLLTLDILVVVIGGQWNMLENVLKNG